jgi:hypothetical protein
MEATFGFLTQPETFMVTLPDTIDPVPEQVAAVGLMPQESLNIQCARSDRVNFASFGWRNSYEVSANGSSIDVYECDDPPDVVMPAWTVDDSVLWMQLRAKPGSTRGEALAAFAGGILPQKDAHGIVRLSLTGGLTRANPVLHATSRDTILFRLTGTTRMLVLRNDGALGKEGRFVDGDFGWASATTPFGITVERDGEADERDDLYSEAKAIAESIRASA